LLHADKVRVVAYSPDGSQLLTAADDGTISWWDPATGMRLGKPLRSPSPVSGLVVAPDGGSVVVKGKTQAQLWDMATRKAVGEPVNYPPSSYDHTVNFGPDGKARLGATIREGFRVWELGAGNTNPQTLSWDHSQSVAMAPDGKTLFLSGFSSDQ